MIEKAWQRLKQRLKAVTRKTAPKTFDERIAKIKEIQRGWLIYFRGTSIHGKLRSLDGWLRNRLRYCIWTDWKKPERKRKNFIRLGIDLDHAYAWSRTRKGGWAVAQSPILGSTITKERLKKRGYASLLDVYLELNPSGCEPPYTKMLVFCGQKKNNSYGGGGYKDPIMKNRELSGSETKCNKGIQMKRT